MSRVPRSSLFYFVLIVLLGFVFWFTWQQFETGSKGTAWSYSQLVNTAQSGQVKSIDIKGNDAVAVDRTGVAHDVKVPDDTSQLASDLSKDGVDVKLSSASGGTLSHGREELCAACTGATPGRRYRRKLEATRHGDS